MKWILSYLEKYKKEAVLAPLFKLLEAVFDLLVPIVMARIIDVGIAGEDRAYIGRMGGILVLLALVGLSVSVTAQFFAARAAVGTCTAMRQSAFDHIMRLDFTHLDQVGTSTLITRMTSDINQVQAGINMALRLFLRSPIVVVGAMIMAFTIDVRSALIFVIAIPLLALVVYGIMAITMPRYRRVQAGLDRVLGRTRENLTGVRVIRAFGLEQSETEKFEAENAGLTAMQTGVARLSAITNPVTYLIVNGAIIYLIYIGAIQVNLGNLSQGEVVALVNYMNQVLIELVKFANLMVTVTRAMACAQRVESVMALPEDEGLKAGEQEIPTSANAGSEAKQNPGTEEVYLQFDRVGLTYQNAGAETLHDIAFKVRKGQTVGIIGGTGSGKSSLVNLIPCFYPATEGCVLLEGEDVRQIPQKELRSRMGIVPQKAVLFQGTIRSNLLWGNPGATDEELWEALELAQAAEVVRGKEGGLDEPVAQGGRNFSGGQRQRLTIARALVRKPEILILDDSASALDYLTEKNLREAISSLQDATIFIVSQRVSSLRDADLIIVMDDGEIADQGSHEHLLEHCEIYQEIYYSQYEKEKREA